MSKPEQQQICPNCDKEFNKEFAYCPHCGQKNSRLRIGFKHFISDYLSANFNLDSKILLTLKLLLFKPAFLTKEFLKGRQTKYIPPVRLYLVISLAYFFILALNLPSTNQLIKDNQGEPADTTKVTQGSSISDDSSFFNLNFSNESEEDSDTNLNIAQSFIKEKAELLKTKTGEVQFFENMKKYISTGMFILLPFIALIFTLLFFRKKYYIENLLFVVHLQSVILFIAIFFNLLDLVYDANWPLVVELLLFVVITFLWMKNFYETSTWTTIWKQTLFYMGYSILFILYIISIFIASMLLI